MWIYTIFRVKEDPDLITLYGNVDVRQVDIGFRVSGQVSKLVYEEGDRVEYGGSEGSEEGERWGGGIDDYASGVDSRAFFHLLHQRF